MLDRKIARKQVRQRAVTVREKDFDRWSPSIRRRLLRATLRKGYMRKFVRVAPDSSTFVIFSGKQVMGWALVFYNGRGFSFDDEADKSEYLVSFFVNPRYRNRGLGQLLFSKVVDSSLHHHSIIVAEWDKASSKFFRHLRDLFPGRVKIIDWWKQGGKYRKLVQELQNQQ